MRDMDARNSELNRPLRAGSGYMSHARETLVVGTFVAPLAVPRINAVEPRARTVAATVEEIHG